MAPRPRKNIFIINYLQVIFSEMLFFENMFEKMLVGRGVQNRVYAIP